MTGDLFGGGQGWYDEYYARKGPLRNDVLRNAGVQMQVAAYDLAVTRAVATTGVDPSHAQVLDVGAGSGANLVLLSRLGFPISALHGVEIREDLVLLGTSRFPGLKLTCQDARALHFEDDRFDLVFESTMFSTIADDEVAAAIASEMMRVTKSGGHLVLIDWRLANPLRRSEAVLSRRRLRRLFPGTKIERVVKGALVPPVGRAMSGRAPWGYFLVRSLFPFLTGQVAYVLTADSDP